MARRRLAFVRGVRFRMVALVVIPILPIVAIVGWQTSQVRERAHEDAGTDTLRLSRLAAENVTSLVLQTRAVMQVASQLNPNMFATPESCVATLQQGAEIMRSVSNAFVIDGTGAITCSLVPVTPGFSLADRTYVGDAFANGEPSVGIEPIGDLLAAPALVVTEPLGADHLLAVAIDLGADLPSFVERFALPAESTVTMMDVNGVILGRWPSAPSVVGRVTRLEDIADQVRSGGIEGTSEERGSDGVERIYSYVDVAQSAQTVYAVVGVPSGWVLGPANREERTNLIALAVLAIITIILALFLAERSVNRHLRAIASTTRRIGGGDLTARVGPRRASTELEELASSVDQMAADLQARDQALRTSSAERARLVDELLDTQEDERRRIAADIHDDTIQTVVACGMSAQLLRGRLSDPATLAQADQLAQRLAAATARLRQLTFDLDPASNGLGVAEGLERYLVGALDGRPMVVTVSAEVDAELGGPVRQVVFRNVREATLNAAVHGGARRVVVFVEEHDAGVRVDVTDDGVGFEPDPRGWPGHQGVRTMRHRAEALGGWFELVSAAGRGTRVSFWVPLTVDDQLQQGLAPLSNQEMVCVG
jgi:signal transduction histidine kinase